MGLPAGRKSLRGSHSWSGGGVGYERPYFAYLLNTPALPRHRSACRIPDRLFSLDQPAQVQPEAAPYFRFHWSCELSQILQSEEFWSALWITLAFTGLAVTFVVVLGLAIALLLNRDFPGRDLVRTLILLPWAIPPVVNGLMWQWIYDSKVGALNGLLLSLGIISEYRGWLSDPTSALLALVCADVWNAVPLAVILLLAALQRIPVELYDVARVDGGSAFQLFRSRDVSRGSLSHC